MTEAAQVVEGSALPRRLMLEKFPVTILLLLQYGVLVALPAFLHSTEPEGTILGICALGVFIAFVVEAVIAPIGRAKASPARVVVTWRGARAIMVLGWAATWAATFAGHGNYATGIGTASTSKVASALTPFDIWPLIGLGLALALYRSGRITRPRAIKVLIVSLVLELVLSFYDARLAPFMAFALAAAFLAVITRVIRLRWVVVAVIAVSLLWPAMYSLRNQYRVQQGEIVNPYAPPTTAGQRLRLDLEVAQIAKLPTIPANIGQPSLPTLVRFGLVPRVFDSGRGTINTNSGLSVALGGPATSSNSVTALGSSYVEHGWPGIVVYAGFSSVLVAIVVRRRNPWALALLGIIVVSSLWIESAYPDMVAGLLQDAVSLLGAVLVVHLFFRKDRVRKRPDWMWRDDVVRVAR